MLIIRRASSILLFIYLLNLTLALWLGMVSGLPSLRGVIRREIREIREEHTVKFVHSRLRENRI